MSIDTISVGGHDREIIVLGDPNAAGNNQSVLSVADARSLSGLYAGVVQNVPILVNQSGTLDQQRSAIGTTGIPAVNSEGSKATYSCGVIAFTPVATPTDFFTLVGSATKIGRLLRISISGIATAAISVDIQLIKRSTANSGGTSAQPTIAQHDSNDSAPTCVVNTYSVNPTTGSGVGTVRAGKLNLGAPGAAGQLVWDFTTRNGKGLVLRGIAQAYVLNWAGAAVPSGTLLDIDVEFSEE